MYLSPLKASLAALTLCSTLSVAVAAQKQPESLMPTAQVEDSAQELVKIRQFLSGGKDITKMKLPRLQERLHRAETFRDVQGLPPDVDQALQQEIARITQEITRRQQGGAEPPQVEAQQQPEPQIEQPPLPPYDPQQVQGQPPAEPGVEQPVAPSADPQQPPVRKRKPAQQGEAQPPVPAEQPPLTQQPPAAQQPGAPPPATVTDKQLANPTVNPALERRAQAYLSDNVDVRSMKRKQLRKRLSDMRDLLAANQLSPQTRDALRQKLARERAVLRNDVAVEEGLPPPQPQPPAPEAGQQPKPQQPAPQQPPRQGGNNAGTANNGSVDVRIVLQDRRPPQQLDDRDLVRRIDVYRDAVADDRYDAEQRMMWRQQMEADRRYLRRQMMAERQQREARLRQGDYQFDYDVQDRYEPGYDVPDDVFAAEADDEELAGVLAAPPRRDIQRRYTVDDIERYPEARNAVARIEIDTVHFGFGEGYLREEEIDKLDRIASVLERILARHPDEVFLIEGHTDAVGSDAANLALSRQRAAAVKQALTTYYVIPPDNLRTVGLGERYLKIPTDQPEAENRRVSLARITPLVGQAAD